MIAASLEPPVSSVEGRDAGMATERFLPVGDTDESLGTGTYLHLVLLPFTGQPPTDR